MNQPLSVAAGIWSSRRQFLAGGLAVGAAASLAACGVTGAKAQKGSGGNAKSAALNALFMQQAGYSTSDVAAMIKGFNAQNPAIKIVPTFVTYEALHDKIVTAAAAGTYDVVLIDVIWPAELFTKSIIADVTSKYPADWQSSMLGGALDTAKYQSKEYGITWGMDTKFFYYNKKQLSKAGIDASSLDTWDGVLTAARAVKSKAGVNYPLAWSWSQAEAIICDYAQLVGAFGGSFLDSSGKLIINSGGEVQALEWMRQTIVDKLTNPASTTFLEGDVEKTMNNGQATFGLNWTYYLGSSNTPANSKVVGDIVCIQTPAGPGGQRPGVNGAMALAISSGSKHQDAAWTFMQYLTSEPVLDNYAKEALPIWKKSYDTTTVVATAPETFAAAGKQLNEMIVRPQVVNYNSISQVIQVELQNALLGKKSAQKALDDAVSKAAPLMSS